MTNRTHHVFFSYARADNGEDNNQFVTRFHDLLCKQHEAVTGRELKTFFDTEAIEEGEHWKTRLGQGLRDSRLFLAFLSDNYLKSPVCKWEWEHYLLTEHTAARGEDGVVPLYFIPIDELGRATEEQLEEWVDEIKQRNLGAYCQLQPWYQGGSDRARELDAADRAIALREVDVESEDELTLPERISRLNLRICRRLDRIHLAEQVIGNVVRPYRHFVGRHKQLRELHEALTVDQTSLLATVHSPGGLGKSALARQYAIAYADFYAAGGVWELKCAGLAHLGDALRQLEQQKELKQHGFSLEDDREKPADQQAQSALAQLKRITHSRRDTVNQQLRDLKNRHTPEDQLEVRENSRCLLILDNVDKTELLAADQLGLIPAEDWLSVIVTTRLSPDSFGAATSLRSIQVPPLSLIEGVELLRTFMPNEAFADAEETKAAEELVKALDGYTIALELIGAFVHTNWKAGARLGKYLRTLEEKGLAATDELAGKKGMQEKIAYQHKQIALIVEDSLASLRRQLAAEHSEEMATAAQQIIEIASLLQPDTLPAAWLKSMLEEAHPDLQETDEGLESWGIIAQALMQLSLLSPAERQADSDDENMNVLRMHRVTAAHIAGGISDEGGWYWRQIESYLERLLVWMEQDSTLETLMQHNQHQQWLIAQASHLLNKHPSPKILRSLHLAVSLEGQHRSLSLAIELAEAIRKHRDALLTRYPYNADAARDLSVSQNGLGDFYLQRGKAGDAERALGYYEASLKIAENLHRCNPAAAEAARDLSVSQEVLGHFYLRRGRTGDAGRALSYFEAALKIREDLQTPNPDSAQAARDLSVSQNQLGDFHLQRGQSGDAERAIGYYQACHKTLEDLHARNRNPESAGATRDLSVSQQKLGGFYLQRGQPGDAERALGYYEACHKTFEELHGRNPESVQAARDLSVSQNELGDFHLQRGRQGDAERALIYYEASLSTREDLQGRNPDIAQPARDLSISQEKLGNFYFQRGQAGDAERALGYYELSLKTREELHARNPDGAQTARDLSLSQEKLGDFYLRRGQPGDTERALGYYNVLLKITEDLYRRNPDSAQIARDFSRSQNRLGNFYLQRGQPGDADRALGHYEALLKITKDLHCRNPDSAEAARDLSISQEKLANFYLRCGRPADAERARGYYEVSLKIREELHTRNPDSAQAARDLSVAQNKLGNFYLRRDAGRALGYYAASEKIAEDLHRRNPDSAEAARDLSVSQEKLGNFYLRRGRPGDLKRALAYYTASEKIAEDLHRRNPDSAKAAGDLSVSQHKLAGFLLQRGQTGDAEQALEYMKAAAQTLEVLLERGEAGPEAVQQLVTNQWNVAMVAQQVNDDADIFHRACARSHQLLKKMRENGIPLDQHCKQIWTQLEQMLSDNESQ